MLTQEVITKRCYSCGQTKSVDEFHKDISRKDRLHPKCKECSRLYDKNNKKTNKVYRKIEDIEFLPEEKICPSCKIIKPQFEFHLNRSSLDGLSHWCSECNRVGRLGLNFNITQVQYDLLLEKQNGVCAICGKTPNENNQLLSVDHNHETSKVRGLLCSNCNTAIGMLKDNSKLLRKASNYLDSHA